MMEFPVDLPPEYSDLTAKLKISPDDIDEHFTRGGGPGGQKINKTTSCVELTHQPTGLTVRVQRHREQSRNRLAAYKQLINKIAKQVGQQQAERDQRRHKLRKRNQPRPRKIKEKMLEAKRRRGALKASRSHVAEK